MTSLSHEEQQTGSHFEGHERIFKVFWTPQREHMYVPLIILDQETQTKHLKRALYGITQVRER
jgi:hypothetical protein